MRMKVSLSLLGTMIVVVVVILGSMLYNAVTSAPDGWDIFSPVDTTTDAIAVDPANLLKKDDRDSLEHVVNETRGFGIPWSVWVVSRDQIGNDRSAQEVARDRMDSTPVESREGAGDGLLMVVVVPDDHTRTEVAFATGPNFYPKGGITPERLDYIANVQMAALIKGDRIGEAVIEGATWVEWTQLFEPTPDAPPTELQRGLRDLLDPTAALAFGALALLMLIAAVSVAILTRRGSGTTSDLELNGILAATIARGRSDHAVAAGIVLDAVDRGVIRFEQGRYLPTDHAVAASETDTALLAELAEMEQAGIPATPGNLTRSIERRTSIRQHIEDILAEAGALHPRSPVYTTFLRGLAGAGTAIGALGLVLAVLGKTSPVLAAALALTVISLATLLWNERRSWATRYGGNLLAAWKERHREPNDRERVVYETIVGYETLDLLGPNQSPVRDDARPLLPSPTR